MVYLRQGAGLLHFEGGATQVSAAALHAAVPRVRHGTALPLPHEFCCDI